MKSLFIN